MLVDDTQPMPEGWISHPNSTDKFSRRLVVDRLPSGKMSATPVVLAAKLRFDGAGWRWNIHLTNAGGRTGQHVATGWRCYRLEAAEEADASLVALVARYHLGAL